MFAKPTLPFLLIMIALNAACCLAGECAGGNFPCAQLSKEECQSYEWSTWCTINDNKIDDWDPDCTGTVFCHQLTDQQCTQAPAETDYGGCTYTNKNHVASSVIIALASVAVALLIVTVYLLLKVTKAMGLDSLMLYLLSCCRSTATAAGEAGTTTEPLLSGADA